MLRTKAARVAGGIFDHIFEVDCFMDRCLKFKHKMGAVVAPYVDMCKDMQKKGKTSEDHLLLP